MERRAPASGASRSTGRPVLLSERFQLQSVSCFLGNALAFVAVERDRLPGERLHGLSSDERAYPEHSVREEGQLVRLQIR